MKSNIYLFIIISIFSLRANAQVVEWLNLFDVHGTGSAITPNSLIDNEGKITTLVVEDYIIKLYQTTQDGTITNIFTSDKTNYSDYTPLIRTGDGGQALVFRANPYPGTFWLLHTDENLNIIKDIEIQIPSEISFPHIRNLIEYNNQFYLTTTSNGNHHLLKINNDDSLSIIYNGSIESSHGEDYILLDNGNIIFSYKSRNNHIIRCVSLTSESLVWEQSLNTNYGNLLQYRVKENDNILYAVGLERAWVDGSADDNLTISHIDVTSGEILFQEPVDLPPVCDNCSVEFNHFVYNSVNDHMYISYISGFPESAILLFEIDNQTTGIINQHFFPYIQNTELLTIIGQESYIHINEDGQVVFLYESYKDETEKGNLYIAVLDEQLNPVGELLEINIDEQNSNETVMHVLQYGPNKILITGVTPDPTPFISWEETRFFISMIDLEDALSSENQVQTSNAVTLYPNPVKSELFIRSDKNIESISIFDYSGKKILSLNSHNNKKLDVSGLSQGIYLMLIKDIDGNQHWSKFIKQ